MPVTSKLPARYSPRPLRTVRARVGRSAFARDLRQDGYFIAACGLILFCGLLVVLLTRGSALGWDGVYQLPAELPSCGDYCGTDAGPLGG